MTTKKYRKMSNWYKSDTEYGFAWGNITGSIIGIFIGLTIISVIQGSYLAAILGFFVEGLLLLSLISPDPSNRTVHYEEIKEKKDG